MFLKEIFDRNDKLISELLGIWERSVKASHKFLTDEEIENIKEYVPQAFKGVEHLIVAFDDELPLGFIGINERKIEMLFIDGNLRGKGFGSSLINYALKNFNVNEVVVNEQNPLAHNFYLKVGFKDFSRSELDEQGNPYPIITMRK